MTTSAASAAASTYVAPVWFISHGGPPTMFDAQHTAYKHWRTFGQELIQEQDEGRQMKGIVAVSAHWESDRPGVIEVNTDAGNPMVYDYYGFPDDYYKVKVHAKNPKDFSSLVLSSLNDSFKTDTCNAFFQSAEPTKRGLDHGVFVPLKVAFSSTPADPKASLESSLPPTLPLVEITLPPPSSQNFATASLQLGKALRKLRTEHKVGVFAGGMPVHNLRELGKYMDRSAGAFKFIKDAPYAKPFLEAISSALNVDVKPAPAKLNGDTSPQEEEKDPRWEALTAVTKRPDYKQAHPTDEHFMPLFVALGATFPHERLHESMKKPEGSMGWIQYRTGA